MVRPLAGSNGFCHFTVGLHPRLFIFCPSGTTGGNVKLRLWSPRLTIASAPTNNLRGWFLRSEPTALRAPFHERNLGACQVRALLVQWWV